MEQKQFDQQAFNRLITSLKSHGAEHEIKNRQALHAHNQAYFDSQRQIQKADEPLYVDEPEFVNTVSDVAPISEPERVGKSIVEFISTIPGVDTEGMLDRVARSESIALSDRAVTAWLRKENGGEVGMSLTFGGEGWPKHKLKFDRIDPKHNMIDISMDIDLDIIPLGGEIRVGENDDGGVIVRQSIQFDPNGIVLSATSEYADLVGEKLDVIKMIRQVTTSENLGDPIDPKEMIENIRQLKITDNSAELLNELATFEEKSQASSNPAELFDEVANLAKKEEELGIKSKHYKELSVEEIIKFGESIKNAKNMEEKYKLMMQKTESGKLWYDVLLGESNAEMFSLVEQSIKDRVNESGKFKVGVDIGTGTGNTLRAIAPYCDRAYGIDYSDFVLNAARDEGLPKNSSVLVGSAEKLPLSTEKVDLVVANGLVYYLSAEETKEYVNEIHRVLKTGGKYYISIPTKLDSSQVLVSAKAALMDNIGSMATEGGHPDNLGLKDFNELLRTKGFIITGMNNNDHWMMFEYSRISKTS